MHPNARKKSRNRKQDEIIIPRPGYVISIFGGVCGYGTKNGFTPFRYDEFIAWAKKQGPKYARLYKPVTKRFFKRKGKKRSLCAKLHFQANCQCVMVVTDSRFPDRETISPTPLETELWAASERERKESRCESGLRTRPRCPAQLFKYPCPLAQSCDDDQADDVFDTLSDRKPDCWKNWSDCKVPESHVKPSYEALDDWLDADNTVIELFQLLDDE